MGKVSAAIGTDACTPAPASSKRRYRRYHSAHSCNTIHQDIGIPPDQFAAVLEDAADASEGHELESALRVIAAADDFLLFKALMVQKNLDLEMYAVSLSLTHSPSSLSCLLLGLVFILSSSTRELLAQPVTRCV